jgi:uroporphyrinogen III methyltransferase/synthase
VRSKLKDPDFKDQHEATQACQLSARPSGFVYFVGAGPGDPGLLTLRAVECLAKADCVLADRLVPPETLKFAKPGAKIVQFQHHSNEVPADGASVFRSREDFLSLMVTEAKQGKIVVRLKSGCPEIFAHQSEEQAILRDAGIPYQIIPGVTAGLAAAAYAGIPLTDSDCSSAVALVTGHEKSPKRGTHLDYELLAQFPGTLVFYMGVKTAPQWSQALIRGGRSANTPVTIVCRCSWPDQRIVRCQLSNVAETIVRNQVEPPAIIIVGEVAGQTLSPQSDPELE